ncbi:MAG: CDP-diacylglycerol--glycerol-3-phosphate 3-phosphatidyltransferase [Clostridiales bacterium]|uniref:CDP-diacylglycerol--glycerol-3-phosphate 3-phosphatidyltransferase n=1 Tax=Clostridium sp. N3C TaxID=1776758 RepID=UPI00092E032A|nr:CDP-diacylglycerol--glycerol-3-phosphate 3-phosphatidyltransferase [Clostridium sp. N3C]NLZ50039.1 CDP-diacylglycerol--glycerol-3-phosphate 3-phosphatidyltransferase [Clostridiales bacterium]SCN25311.1 putative CDP-diacylglycerol-glycerol-3-phosphate 3-phosphatidyl-transferase 2 [Clostridium sp. N3C]
MNIPNILTLFRLFLIPVFVLFFFSSIDNNLVIAISIFLLAGATDVLDGYIARKYNLVTKWGMVIDPLADKLMLLTVLICLSIKGYIPLLIVILVAMKDSLMIISGLFLFKKDTVIPANIFGKASTFLFYLSIFILPINKPIANIAIKIAVVSAFVALINYSIIYLKNRKLESKTS